MHPEAHDALDLEYAASVADQAIKSMSRHTIAPTPANFAVWFFYELPNLDSAGPAPGGTARSGSAWNPPFAHLKSEDREHGQGEAGGDAVRTFRYGALGPSGARAGPRRALRR